MKTLVKKTMDAIILMLISFIIVGVLGMLIGITFTPIAIITGYLDILDKVFIVSGMFISISSLLLIILASIDYDK